MNLLFGFSGRIGRAQWWLAQLVVLVVIIFCAGAAGVVGARSGPVDPDAGLLGGAPLAILAIVLASVVLILWINLASCVKRFHDRGKSGFWVLIVLIPYIGQIWQVVECGFLAGTPGGNDYGGDTDGFGFADDLEDSGTAYASIPLPRPEPAPATRLTPRPSATGRRAAAAGFGRRGL